MLSEDPLDSARWERIQEIFFAASELDPASRPAYLDAACHGEDALRREVERYLQSTESDTDFLTQVIHSEAVAAAVPDSEPERIGPYRILRKLGQGGMGAVYLAERDDRQFQQKVAIKLLRPEAAASPELLLRFRTERQILADLDHPNIARMLTGGVTSDGVPFLAMEYIEGTPLDAYCRERSLSVQTRLDLFGSICSAVQYAHRNLVVHRDIKPSNILITAAGIPKLLDFGIAKLLKPEDHAHTVALTRPAERLMTLEYASPEQVRGAAITTATDVYALGLVLYELLAGVPPFDLSKLDHLEALRAICETPPAPPSRVAGDTALPADLDNIVLHALRKEPSERYASVDQLSDDLRCYLQGFPVSASHGTRRYRAAKFVRRHRFAVGLSTAAAVLVLSFGVGMAVLAARAARERDRAQQVSRFLTGLFGSLDPFLNQGANAAARELLDTGSRRIHTDLPGQPEVRADLLQTMARAYQHLGFKAEAETAFREQARAAEQAYGADSVQVSGALRQLADVERQRSELALAEADLRRALAIQRKRLAPTDIELAHTLNNLGLVLQTRGDLAGAEPLFRDAIAISGRYPEQVRETLAMMSNLGSVLADGANYTAAEPVLREVLSRRIRLLGPNHPQVALSTMRLATLLFRKGAWTESESLFRDSLRRYQSTYSDSHPETLIAQGNLAVVLQETGRLAEAEALYRKSIETGIRAFGETVETAVTSANLASLLTATQRYPEAELLFQHALDTCRAKIGPGSTREARILEQRGVLLQTLGRHDAARADFQLSLSIRRDRLGPTHPDVAVLLFDLGQLQEAVDLDRRALPAGHPQLLKHERALAAQARRL
jgi:serine/threonine-protein kinase